MTGEPDPFPLVERGLAVFPLPVGGRRPTAPGWHERCIVDAGRLAQEWTPGANIGVGCRASRVVALDLDRHPGGVDGIAVFGDFCAAPRQTWPATFTVRTPHGVHLYFRAPAESSITSSSGGRTGLGPGIDSRGPGRRIGGYLIGPGSLVNGNRYRIEHDKPIAALPAWLAPHLTQSTPATRPKDQDG